MNKPKVLAHAPYIGPTGYNNHARDFFRRLSKLVDIKVRNYTVGNSWAGNSDECHNGESYINDIDKKLLVEQTLHTTNGRKDFPIYTKYKNNFKPNVNLILAETEHHYFYDNYTGPKIGYNVWESTLQPKDFFNKLLEYDQIWVPSQWQADCTISQGIDKDKIKVVPEGVDTDIFFPEEVELLEEYKNNKFKFILFGRFDYRKSTKEIIETFLNTFSQDEDVELIVSIDNPFSRDDYKTTEDRLKHHGIDDKRIKIKHFPSREDYISYLKTGHIFLSCARSEGWNLPLIEAMACGTPSIYSKCSGQMEFAKNKGLPVKILGEKPANDANYNHWNSLNIGNYYEPDFGDLSNVMRDAYENYEIHKLKALDDAKIIHKDFNWGNIAKIGKDTLVNFLDNYKEYQEDEIILTYNSNPKVEIKGFGDKKYTIKFINHENNEVIFQDSIKTNMWTTASYKSYIKWRVEVWEDSNKILENILNLDGEKVLIEIDSNSIGDTIAWFPYIEEFRKKHNCKIICSTFHNNWFKSKYPKIQFVEPEYDGERYITYNVGWFYKENEFNREYHKNDFKSQPLQKTASDILGLEFIEINPKIKIKSYSSKIQGKYVTLSIQSTAQSKYWNHPTGWQQVVDFLISKDYKVILVDKDKEFGCEGFFNYAPEGVVDMTKCSLDEATSIISKGKFHLGISSGLSWVAWATNVPVVLISSFSKPYCEFTTNCIRIYNETPTSGYFNTHKLDPSDWNWYPFMKIKSKKDWHDIENITPEQVINQVKKLL